MRNQLKTFYSALLIVATLGLTSTVHGVPAFARQTGLDCNSCHAASGFPTLNAFGAAFKAGGYSQANEDDLIGDGEALSIPKTLNLSVVLKARNPIEGGTDTSGTATDSKSTLEMPDEMALLIGGRLGKNAGFLIEDGFDAAVSAKFVFAPEIGPVRLGIVPWFTDLGAGYIFETMSTGAVRNIRPAERVKGAANAVGITDPDGEQAGLGLYVWHPMGFIAFTPFFGEGAAADWSNDAATATPADNLGYYTRVAVTPTFGDVALGVGFQYYSGKTTGASATVSTLNAFAIDAQAMMDVGIPLSIYVTFGMDSENTIMDVEGYVEAAIVPDVFMAGVFVGYGTADGATTAGVIDNSTKFGVVAKYHFFRNVKAELNFTYAINGNDQVSDTSSTWEIMPLIFGAF